MLFTLKILRYIFGLIIRAILSPFKTVWRLVDNQESDDESLEPGGSIKAEMNTTADLTTKTGSPNAVSGDGTRTRLLIDALEDGSANPVSDGKTDELNADTEVGAESDTVSPTPTASSNVDEPETSNAASTGGETSEFGENTEKDSSSDESTLIVIGDTDSTTNASTAETDSVADTDQSEPATPDATAGETATETRSVEDLRKELSASSASTRHEAVEELANRVQADDAPEQGVIDELSDRLDDEDPSVRAAACEALGSLGASKAKPALKERRIDPDHEVSRAATRAIRNLE